MKKGIATLAIAGMLALTGCVSEADNIRERAKAVEACKAAGGEWYNTPGWGEDCNFDTRKEGDK